MEIRRSKKGAAGYPLLESVEPVMLGVLRLTFDDAYESVLDLRPLFARKAWAGITKEEFFAVQIQDHGSYIYWPNNQRPELPADGLRRDCERQDEIHMLMYEPR